MPINYTIQWAKRLSNRDFFLFDIIIFLISPIIASYLRFDGVINWKYIGSGIIIYSMISLVIKMSAMYIFGIYRRYWKYASVDDLGKLALILFVMAMFEFVAAFYFSILTGKLFMGLPVSISILTGIISSMFITASRISIRLMDRVQQRLIGQTSETIVLIAGAGQAGVMVLEELLRNPKGGTPIAFVDDDQKKQRMKIRGIEVKGRLDEISSIVKASKINKVIIALPTAPGKIIRNIVEQCNSLHVEVLTLPGIFEIINGKVNINSLRNIQVEDLLRRDTNKLNTDEVSRVLEGKIIAITGSGGSIGGELCRQIINFKPKKLILIGHGENSIFEIEQELRQEINMNSLAGMKKDILKSYIVDIRDYDRLKKIFEKEKPEIIFHAAAHKHVPLMEENPEEAVTNNVLGTRNLVNLSNEFGVDQFVLISSDKAVNPTSIMGVTKRIAELIMLNASKKKKCRFGAVRFGNVLGSRGSVIKTFHKQLKNGGPITITHPDIKRYFMTIPEAVSLVLQVCVYNKGGEIFILEMGEPIKIIDLAKDMIKLSGLREGYDVDIKITGLRPGEKLFEELFIPGEVYDKTRHEKIYIAKNASLVLDSEVENKIEELINYAHNGADNNVLLEKIYYIVPEFDHKSN